MKRALSVDIRQSFKFLFIVFLQRWQRFYTIRLRPQHNIQTNANKSIFEYLKKKNKGEKINFCSKTVIFCAYSNQIREK